MTMTLTEFARRYKEVRRLQVAYFKRRDPGVLEQSKAAEKELDKLADEVLDPPLYGSEE